MLTCFVSMKQTRAHRNIVDIDVLHSDNLLDPDNMTYRDIYLFHLMGQLTDNGLDDIIDSFRKQVLEFYRVAVVELKQLPFDDPILGNRSLQSGNTNHAYLTIGRI